mmetsp:Transcript_51216/g.123640  ORF Transcript_51216/g.123640 Transcript_51216/m.123640 type:complete len:97 (+) Transcript_51216:129-419(+)
MFHTTITASTWKSMVLTATSRGSMATSTIGMAATVGRHGVRRFATVQPLSYQSPHTQLTGLLTILWIVFIGSIDNCQPILHNKHIGIENVSYDNHC